MLKVECVGHRIDDKILYRKLSSIFNLQHKLSMWVLKVNLLLIQMPRYLWGGTFSIGLPSKMQIFRLASNYLTVDNNMNLVFSAFKTNLRLKRACCKKLNDTSRLSMTE